MEFLSFANKNCGRFLLMLFCMAFSLKAVGQENTLLVEPLGLAEEAMEQEGLFFMPQLQKAALDNPGRAALEKALQTSVKSS
ncbi:MAG: hypothetical protein ACKPB3_09085, partial [Bacteroidota bacterium]